MQPPSRRPLEAVIRDQNGHNIARCLLRRGRYIIGQDGKNEIVVDEPSVSLKHARLTVSGDDELFFIEDLDSVNGTRVNGKPGQGAMPVTLDCKVEIGHTTLEFQRAGLPASVFDSLPDGFLRKNRYNMGDAIIEGSTSTIFEAFDTSLGRNVAIKVMRPEAQADPILVLRFVREAQIGSQLQHPGILPIYELDSNEESQLFYTTRFVEGESLASMLKTLADADPAAPPCYSLHLLLSIFQKVCDTVAFAHSRGVIHCGLHPENITIGDYGEVFVGHWALAKVDHRDASGNSLIAPLRVAATDSLPRLTGFTSPEQAASIFDEIDARSDLYSLGAILYQILTLEEPIDSSSETPLLDLVLTNSIEPISTFTKAALPHWPGGNFPEALSDIATRALNQDRLMRFASVSELQQAVASFKSLPTPGDNNLWKQLGGFLGKH